MDERVGRVTRRRLMAGIGVAAAGVGAGCAGGDGAGGESGGSSTPAPNEPTSYAAFFTLADWSRNVAGDEMSVVNPVPAGEMGHGWEPGSDLLPELARSDAFVYFDSPEFRWAQDVASAVRGDDSADVVLVDALEGVDLLEWNADEGGDRDHQHEGHENGDEDHEHEDGHSHDHEDGHDDQEGDHEDDHGRYDPHVWLDPVRARTAIDNVAEGFAEADPESADAYARNAEAYESELRDLHETYEAELDGREHDVLVLAAHNSFQYLGDRYGFEIHSPAGASPQGEPDQEAIRETIDLVDRMGVEYVAYDRFQSPRLAETIVRESTASDVVGLSPAEGTTPDWEQRGWGYVDQMIEVNLDALTRALGAD